MTMNRHFNHVLHCAHVYLTVTLFLTTLIFILRTTSITWLCGEERSF